MCLLKIPSCLSNWQSQGGIFGGLSFDWGELCSTYTQLLSVWPLLSRFWGQTTFVWPLLSRFWGQTAFVWSLLSRFWGQTAFVWSLLSRFWGQTAFVWPLLSRSWGQTAFVWPLFSPTLLQTALCQAKSGPPAQLLHQNSNRDAPLLPFSKNNQKSGFPFTTESRSYQLAHKLQG